MYITVYFQYSKAGKGHYSYNKHTESIAKAIQVPHRPQQIQICNHYFTALFEKSHVCESIAKRRLENEGQ